MEEFVSITSSRYELITKTSNIGVRVELFASILKKECEMHSKKSEMSTAETYLAALEADKSG